MSTSRASRHNSSAAFSKRHDTSGVDSQQRPTRSSVTAFTMDDAVESATRIMDDGERSVLDYGWFFTTVPSFLASVRRATRDVSTNQVRSPTHLRIDKQLSPLRMVQTLKEAGLTTNLQEILIVGGNDNDIHPEFVSITIVVPR